LKEIADLKSEIMKLTTSLRSLKATPEKIDKEESKRKRSKAKVQH
jgi:hypothetical protein